MKLEDIVFEYAEVTRAADRMQGARSRAAEGLLDELDRLRAERKSQIVLGEVPSLRDGRVSFGFSKDEGTCLPRRRYRVVLEDIGPAD